MAPFLDLSGYLFLGVIFALFFVIQHAVLHVFIRILYPEYMKMNSHDFHEYRMQVNALVHAVFATAFSFYCMFFTCPNGETFFSDETCRQSVRNIQVWTCYFTASYLMVDTVFLLVFTGVPTALDKQTLVHHVLGFLNFYALFWQQDFSVALGAAIIVLEISTPFVCMRWLLFHHG